MPWHWPLQVVKSFGAGERPLRDQGDACNEVNWDATYSRAASSKHSPTKPNTAQHIPTQPNTIQHNPAQPNPTRPDPTQPNTAQPNLTQPNPAQPNPVQPNPTQPSSAPTLCSSDIRRTQLPSFRHCVSIRPYNISTSPSSRRGAYTFPFLNTVSFGWL